MSNVEFEESFGMDTTYTAYIQALSQYILVYVVNNLSWKIVMAALIRMSWRSA